MAYYGLKEATKDIDAVLLTEKESELLVCSLLRAGYHHLDTLILSGAYRSMQASSTVENQDGFRWDVFTKRVANTLSLTEPMMKRGKGIYEAGKLKLISLSKEDIFLMKGMTERELDLEDMYILSMSLLDYNVILKECELQSGMGDMVWEAHLYTKCEEFKKKYGVAVPIERKLRLMSERKITADAVYRLISGGAKDKETLMRVKGKLAKRDVELGLEVLIEKKRIRLSRNGKITIRRHQVS